MNWPDFRLCILLPLLSCGSCSEARGLEEFLEKYADCDIARDTQCIWDMRTPGFREAVDFEGFLKETLVGNQNWTTVEWELLSSELVSENVALLKVVVREEPPVGFEVDGIAADRVVAFQDEIELWKVNGEWYAHSVPFRARFGFAYGLFPSKAY